MRRTERFPIVLMALRLLDHGARYDRTLKALDIPIQPYATEWIHLLGDLLFERRDEARAILYDLDRRGAELSDRLAEDYPEAAAMLHDDAAQPSPVWRLAEALTFLQGRKNTQGHLIKLIDCCLNVNRPNGLGAQRSVQRKPTAGEEARKREVRSIVFTDPILDYLVHLQLLPAGNRGGYKTLSFKDFIRSMRERFGFCIDVAPPGMAISNELLRLNRSVLERRLRDLGLLVGVNDAEAMKLLRPRFDVAEQDDGGVD